MEDRRTEITRVFDLMIEEKIPFIMLRSYDFLENNSVEPPAELDILVPQSAFSSIKVFFFNQMYYSKYRLDGWIFRKFLLPVNVTFHIQFGYIHALNMRYFSYDEVLKFASNVSGYPCLKGVGLLGHLCIEALIQKGKFKAKYRLQIQEQLLLPNMIEKLFEFLSKYFPKNIISQLIHYVTEGKFEVLERRRLLYAFYFLLKNPQQLGDIGKHILFRLRQRLILPRKGTVVAFIGVDGVGKTTICKALLDILKCFGYKMRYVYMGRLRKHVLPMDKVSEKIGISGAQISQPGRFYCFARDLVYTFDMFLRYLFFILPYKVFNHVILCDRYAYDMYFDKHQTFLSKWVLKYLYPKPDLLILLELDEARIVDRKDEYDSEQSRFLIARCRMVAKQFRAQSMVTGSLEKNCFLVYELVAKNFWLRKNF